jgi:hypothetical protein
MNPFAAAVWWVTLLGSLLLFVPNLVSWLIRTLGAARYIERYSEEILAAGAGIAENTANVKALKDTLALAPSLVDAAGSIEAQVTSIEAALAPRASGGSRSQEGRT